MEKEPPKNKMSEVKFTSWNTLGMKFCKDDQTLKETAENLKDEDFIIFQEVPSGVGVERMDAFLKVMGSDWEYRLTKAAGINHRDPTQRTKPQYHAFLFRPKRWRFVEEHLIGDCFDYQPMVMVFERIASPHQTIWLTSVHFPPLSRRDALKAHHENFPIRYLDLASAKGCGVHNKASKIWHIIGGDFNDVPKIMIEKMGFVAPGNTKMITSKGQGKYDHFLINSYLDETENIIMPLTRHNLDFSLSDHLPVHMIVQFYELGKAH